MFNPDRAQQV
jgi:DNA replication licensing factor MCM4